MRVRFRSGALSRIANTPDVEGRTTAWVDHRGTMCQLEAMSRNVSVRGLASRSLGVSVGVGLLGVVAAAGVNLLTAPVDGDWARRWWVWIAVGVAVTLVAGVVLQHGRVVGSVFQTVAAVDRGDGVMEVVVTTASGMVLSSAVREGGGWGNGLSTRYPATLGMSPWYSHRTTSWSITWSIVTVCSTAVGETVGSGRPGGMSRHRRLATRGLCGSPRQA